MPYQNIVNINYGKIRFDQTCDHVPLSFQLQKWLKKIKTIYSIFCKCLKQKISKICSVSLYLVVNWLRNKSMIFSRIIDNQQVSMTGIRKLNKIWLCIYNNVPPYIKLTCIRENSRCKIMIHI